MIRRPVVAGMFYPLGMDALKQTLSELFESTKTNEFLCVVSPHAGYQYSGKTAAFAIQSLKPNKTFIVLGPNHNLLGHDFSIMSSGEWETPLGRIKIDNSLAESLKHSKVLEEDDISHAHEHSIEVQLPFLQHKFKKFEIVPISIANTDYSEDFLKKCASLGKHIAKILKSNSVSVIASSDFSHYLPKEIADEKDGKAVEEIKKLDANGFFRTLEKIDASVCGYGPIAVLIYIAKELGLKAELIHRTDSGESTGDSSSVVAYYAIGFK